MLLGILFVPPSHRISKGLFLSMLYICVVLFCSIFCRFLFYFSTFILVTFHDGSSSLVSTFLWILKGVWKAFEAEVGGGFDLYSLKYFVADFFLKQFENFRNFSNILGLALCVLFCMT